MSLDDTSFLDEKLSPSRSKYLNQVSTNFSRLLAHFDTIVLNGYAGLSDSEARQCSGTIGLIPLEEFEREPLENIVYKRLMNDFESVKTDDQKKQNFLYDLRRTFLQYHMMLIEADAKTREGMHFVESLKPSPDSHPSIDNMIMEDIPKNMKITRIISEIYKDVYQAMVEITKQCMKER